MDFDHREKGRTGAGRISDAQRQLQQRDRLLKLAMETSDVSKVLSLFLSIGVESISLTKSSGTFRMQIVLDSTQYRGQFPSTYTR